MISIISNVILSNCDRLVVDEDHNKNKIHAKNKNTDENLSSETHIIILDIKFSLEILRYITTTIEIDETNHDREIWSNIIAWNICIYAISQ